jgi:hypothetical protein
MSAVPLTAAPIPATWQIILCHMAELPDARARRLLHEAIFGGPSGQMASGLRAANQRAGRDGDGDGEG